jgi:hypothetical protein
LGTVTGRIIDGRTLKYMKIVKKVVVMEDDMKESQIVSDLMEDFPYIQRRQPRGSGCLCC